MSAPTAGQWLDRTLHQPTHGSAVGRDGDASEHSVQAVWRWLLRADPGGLPLAAATAVYHESEGADEAPSPFRSASSFLTDSLPRRSRAPRGTPFRFVQRFPKRDLSSFRTRMRMMFVGFACGTRGPLPRPDHRCESGVCGGVGYRESVCQVVCEEICATVPAPSLASPHPGWWALDHKSFFCRRAGCLAQGDTRTSRPSPRPI